MFEKNNQTAISCGNSQLGEQKLIEGFTDIVNIDYSEVVVRKSELDW